MTQNLLAQRIESALQPINVEESNRKLIARHLLVKADQFAQHAIDCGDDDIVTTTDDIECVATMSGGGDVTIAIDFKQTAYVSNEKLTVADLRRSLVADQFFSLRNSEVRFVSHKCFAWFARCTVTVLVVSALLAEITKSAESNAAAAASPETAILRQKRDLELELAADERSHENTVVREFVQERARARVAPTGSARSLRSRVSATTAVAPIERVTIRSKRSKPTTKEREARAKHRTTPTNKQAASLLSRIFGWFVSGQTQQQSSASTNYVAAYENDEELFIY